MKRGLAGGRSAATIDVDHCNLRNLIKHFHEIYVVPICCDIADEAECAGQPG